MMFHLVFGLPWLVVATRFIAPLPLPLLVKLLLSALFLVVSQYHYFCRLSSGSVFAPEFPRPLIIAFNLLFGAMVLVAAFQIIADLVSLLLIPVKGHFLSPPPQLRYAMGAAALLLSAFGVAQAIRVPPLKDVEIAIPGLPQAFDGYQLVQLTDLHLSRLFPRPFAEAVVARTTALNADLVVITGDFIDGSVENRRDDVAPLSALKARDGVYAVPGNHEYFFDYDAWMQHLATLNLTILPNAHAVLTRGDARLVVAGVTDLSARRTASPPPDLDRALAGAPTGAPVILLDHQPMTANRNARAPVALQLSGHTHGGMLIGLDRLIARANNGYVSGLYRVGGLQLYVNNGTALWPGFALRLGKPSELTRITLRRAP